MAMPACVVVIVVVAMVVVVIIMVMVIMVVIMVVVVGGGIVMRLPGRVLVAVFVFDVIVAMGMRVAQSGHALRVSRGRRIACSPDWSAARQVLMPAPCAARR